MRLPRVVARGALIASLALIVVPGNAGSRIPTAPGAIDPWRFETVDLGSGWMTMTTTAPDPDLASAGRLDIDAALREPAVAAAAPGERPNPALPSPKVLIRETWKLDNNISWYGPGFNGHNGACGMFGENGLGPEDIGVAHRTLPCGTRVTFRYNGRTVVTQVKDRGPYVAGRIWDMTRGLCEALAHCFTGGGVYYRIG